MHLNLVDKMQRGYNTGGYEKFTRMKFGKHVITEL